MTKPSWMYVARKTVREFSKDQCTDLAAALTYYSVLALFPAAIALLSLVSVFGQGTKTVDTLLGILSDVGASRVPGLPWSLVCWAPCGPPQGMSGRSGAP
jgi:membrane protein